MLSKTLFIINVNACNCEVKGLTHFDLYPVTGQQNCNQIELNAPVDDNFNVLKWCSFCLTLYSIDTPFNASTTDNSF